MYEITLEYSYVSLFHCIRKFPCKDVYSLFIFFMAAGNMFLKKHVKTVSCDHYVTI